MQELKTVIWLVVAFISVLLVLEVVGYRSICQMFPEGKRPWHLPAQLLSLALFAVVVIFNPWSIYFKAV